MIDVVVDVTLLMEDWSIVAELEGTLSPCILKIDAVSLMPTSPYQRRSHTKVNM